MYGIPNMKLDKARGAASRRSDGGRRACSFVTNCEIGKDMPAAKLREEFDAVVLCCGATKPRDLPMEGRELNGIHFAMEFLHGNTKNLLDHRNGNLHAGASGASISAKGKDVIVIGGGDTGTDCVGTSMRHGCRSLSQFEILPQPPDARAGGQSLAGMAQGL